MKKVKILIFFLIIIGGYIIYVSTPPRICEDWPLGLSLWGSHRGDSGYIENTLDSFERPLIDNYTDFIEFDLRYTLDKEIVIYHDASLLRLQKKPIYIEDVTYDELNIYSNFAIPKYSEVLDLVNGKKPMVMEIKVNGDDAIKMVDEIIYDVKRKNILNKTLIITFSNELIQYLNLNYPEVKIGKIYYITKTSLLRSNSLIKENFQEIRDIDVDYVLFYGSFCGLWDEISHETEEFLEFSNRSNIGIFYWTLDDSMYLTYLPLNDSRNVLASENRNMFKFDSW